MRPSIRLPIVMLNPIEMDCSDYDHRRRFQDRNSPARCERLTEMCDCNHCEVCGAGPWWVGPGGGPMLSEPCSSDETLAVCAACPDVDCGALVISYAFPEDVTEMTRGDGEEMWDLTCERCGTTFCVPWADLIPKSVPASWLLESAGPSN